MATEEMRARARKFYQYGFGFIVNEVEAVRDKEKMYRFAADFAESEARASAAQSAPSDPEQLARRFHETYERLAPSFGYETRKASAKPWSEVPENNRKLMIAVCAEILGAAQSAVPSPVPEEGEVYCECIHRRGDHGGMGPSRGKAILSACGLCACQQWRPGKRCTCNNSKHQLARATCDVHIALASVRPTPEQELRNRYASYANHCAIQKKIPVTWHTWKRQERTAPKEGK